MNTRCVSGSLEKDNIVAKVLRSLPTSYKYKVATIDEIQSVTIVTRDMLVGKLAAFELSKFGESHGNSETAFRASAFEKKKYDLGEISCWVSIYEREKRDLEEKERELDEIEALIA